jgi:hypothetical protein
LFKAYGLRIIINSFGTGGKFNIVPLLLTIGAGLGLMSISVLIADCFLLYCTRKRKIFKQFKRFDLNSAKIISTRDKNKLIISFHK